MNTAKWLDLNCKTFVLGRILDALPDAAAPHLRELRIQNAKLQRMLINPPWRDKSPSAQKLLGSASVRKYEKQVGRYAVKVGEQARKVRELTDKSFKALFRQVKPMSNAEFRQWRVKFDASVEGSAKEMKQRISVDVTRILATTPQTGFARAFARIGRRPSSS